MHHRLCLFALPSHPTHPLTTASQVGGSNLVKQEEQLGSASISVTQLFDFCFSENGLTAYRMGKSLASQSFIGWIGEEKYQKLARFCLKYIADIEGLPAMRGTFIEFRNGMINISPVGRNASKEERDEYEAWDKKTKTREKMIAALKKEFPDSGLTYALLRYPPYLLRLIMVHKQVLNRRSNLLRCLPNRLGQDLLSAIHREGERGLGYRIQKHPLLWGQML